MSCEKHENQADSPSDLQFILAIAGRLDAQLRLFAQDLEKKRIVYYAYAGLDSLSSSYSMFKWGADLLYPNSSNDAIHDLMTTPGGIAAFSAESLFLVSFSMLACHFENEKDDAVKKFIASAWPYFRDIMKGLKNAYKGWRSTVLTVKVLGGIDLKYTILPVGLALGVFAAANRFMLRAMVESRKQMMRDNAALLIEIKKLRSMTQEECQAYLNQIKYQYMHTRVMAYIGVATGGFIDGLYLYVGVLSITAVIPPLFLAMTVLCALYTLACIVSRVYEEYDFQVRLFITQTKCKLVLITKQIETIYADLLFLKSNQDESMLEVLDADRLILQLCELLDQFEKNRHLLKQQTTRNYFTACLLGIKNGLYAYSALASLLFAVATVLAIFSVTFPPWLLFLNVALGLVFMIGFLVHSVISHHGFMRDQDNLSNESYDKLVAMKSDLAKERLQTKLVSEESFRESLHSGLQLDPSPQYFFQEWFEVVRSVFSGLGKGQKFVDFAGSAWQEQDEMGHYHDTPLLLLIAAGGASLCGVGLGLRALARGLGRPTLGQVDLVSEIEPIHARRLPEEKPPVETDGYLKPNPTIEKPNPGEPSPRSSKIGFFNTNNKTNPWHQLPHPSPTTNALDNDDALNKLEQLNGIRGLT